jgi:plastocyanin
VKKALLISLVALLPACASQSSSSTVSSDSDSVVILIKDKKQTAGVYEPSSVSVLSGSELIFKNESAAPHNVVWQKHPGEKPAQSDLMAKGASYSISLEKAGLYEYICTLHPTMRGSVSVSQ